jgi:hypothetical protein
VKKSTLIRAPTPPPALVIKRLFLALKKKTVKKSFLFFIEQMVSFRRNISLAFRSVGLYFAALSRLDSEFSESATLL